MLTQVVIGRSNEDIGKYKCRLILVGVVRALMNINAGGHW